MQQRENDLAFEEKSERICVEEQIDGFYLEGQTIDAFKLKNKTHGHLFLVGQVIKV